MDEILKHFPELTQLQIEQYAALGELYGTWNERINVISRKDIGNLYPNHVLHSLSVAKFLTTLIPGTKFMDMGTGGGFPGIPLAIYYPECTFHLVDRIGKKIRVAQAVADAIGLRNVTFQHGDIGECHDKYDYVVSRAVMSLDSLVPLIRKNVSRSSRGNRYSNGLVCLKGGDISDECAGLKHDVLVYPVEEFINEPQFREKLIVYVPI